jgi:hypothetical protein
MLATLTHRPASRKKKPDKVFPNGCEAIHGFRQSSGTFPISPSWLDRLFPFLSLNPKRNSRNSSYSIPRSFSGIGVDVFGKQARYVAFSVRRIHLQTFSLGTFTLVPI